MIQTRLQDMTRTEIENFNNIKHMLRQGKIPAALLNPAIIKQHNENSPSVAKIDHVSQEVSLDALVIRYVADGVQARKSWRDAICETTVKQTDTENFDLSSLSRQERHAEIGLNDE